MGLECDRYRYGASPKEEAFSWCGQLESAKCLDGEKVILRVDALSLCLQLEGAKTVAHCICGVIMTIMVIHYGWYCFSGCGNMDAYKRVGSSQRRYESVTCPR